jgi:hypothetical protein
MIQTPTLRIVPEGEKFRILATSYNRDAPSGLGLFDSQAEAETGMKWLQSKLDSRGKAPTKKQVRAMGAD